MYAIVQKEGLGLDKACEEVKYRYASRLSMSTIHTPSNSHLTCFLSSRSQHGPLPGHAQPLDRSAAVASLPRYRAGGEGMHRSYLEHIVLLPTTLV